MALINCPECNLEISDRANSCPRCGAPSMAPGHVSESDKDSATVSASRPRGILVRYLSGEVSLSTSFWLVFAPVHIVLIMGAGPIGYWWGGLVARHDLPFLFLFYVEHLVSLVAAIGAGASAWRAGGLYGINALVIITTVAGLYLFSGVKVLVAFG